jgi:glycosyltransferase involved in cell wall biosynthesis
MIPAFNEETVIVRAVHGVLASIDVRIEVIVIDDGSKPTGPARWCARHLPTSRACGC